MCVQLFVKTATKHKPMGQEFVLKTGTLCLKNKILLILSKKHQGYLFICGFICRLGIKLELLYYISHFSRYYLLVIIQITDTTI